MDIVRFKSGLGNQMFQYAFLRALVAKGRDAKANIGYYDKHPETMRYCLERYFPNIIIDYISDEEFDKYDSWWKEIKQDEEKLAVFLKDYQNRFFWVEEDRSHYWPEVYQTSNCAFVGYWQTEKYFVDIRETLLNEFSFPKGEEKLQILMEKLEQNNNFISVHIRRGDYLKSTKVFGDIYKDGYYQRAIQFMKSRIKNPIFVFFSDDIGWVKENFIEENAIFIEACMFEEYEAWYDICLMSKCSHNIIANSSFSWWGAWLNTNVGKIVVAPRIWLFDGRETPDICPESWIRL